MVPPLPPLPLADLLLPVRLVGPCPPPLQPVVTPLLLLGLLPVAPPKVLRLLLSKLGSINSSSLLRPTTVPKRGPRHQLKKLLLPNKKLPPKKKLLPKKLLPRKLLLKKLPGHQLILPTFLKTSPRFLTSMWSAMSALPDQG